MTGIHATSITHARTPAVHGHLFGLWGKRGVVNTSPKAPDMRHAISNIVLPLFALAVIWTTIAFPRADDLQRALSTIPQRVQTVDNAGGLTDVRPLVEHYADGSPALRAVLAANSDCFIGLDQADRAKLERCAQPVIETIAQVMAHRDDPVVAEIMTASTEQDLMTHLTVAAAEVCRAVWSTGTSPDHGLDSPACRMAQVQLVSLTGNQ